jgi:hypothetical protein
MLNGTDALTQWAAAWSRADPHPENAYLWTTSMARPFFKGQTTRIRPVICAEHLYKFAAGVTLRSARAELTRATGPCQYGFGRPGGAPLEASEIKAAMSANPTWPTVSLDVKNAFGAVTWTSALQVAEEECPQLGLIHSQVNGKADTFPS